MNPQNTTIRSFASSLTRRWRGAIGAAMVALALASPAVAERETTTPTGWWWLTGVDLGTVNAKIAEGYRMTDVEIDDPFGPTFTCAFVKNTGVHAKGWWWYYNISAAEVSQHLAAHNARLIDLEVDYINGERVFSVVMVDNTGDNQKAWWWYHGATFNELLDLATANGARLIDIDSWDENGVRKFGGVMIKNSGADAKAWWAYSNIDLATVASKLSGNNARLIDIDERNPGTYTVIMNKNTEGSYWWYYVNTTMDFLNSRADQYGARLVDVERYTVNGQTRFMGILLNNSNELETELGDLMRDNTDDGEYGFRLERVNGPTIASIMPDYVFYPASTVKVMHHLAAMWFVDNNPAVTLATPLTVYPNASDSCSDDHTGQPFVMEPLGVVLQDMMWNSDNQRTNAVDEYFGRSIINSINHSETGMSWDTIIQHKLGCGGPNNDPANAMTLRDVNMLYEAVAKGEVFSTDAIRDQFYSLMIDTNWFSDLIDAEAPADLAASDLAEFKSLVRMARKAGNISPDASGHEYRSVAGYLSLPEPECLGGRDLEYVFSIFYDDVIISEGWGLKPAADELLRGEVRTALENWAACANEEFCRTDLNHDGTTDAADLAILLSQWGPCGGCSGDISGNGVVDAQDLAILLAEWGVCPL